MQLPGHGQETFLLTNLSLEHDQLKSNIDGLQFSSNSGLKQHHCKDEHIRIMSQLERAAMLSVDTLDWDDISNLLGAVCW